MIRMPRHVCLLVVVMAWAFAGSCGSESVPRVQPPEPGDVALSPLVMQPARYHRTVMRVSGWCRIEFEGNALYTDQESWGRRNTKKAVWLNLGWPVNDDIRKLDGKYVVVEGLFDANLKGHEGGFAGTIVDIHQISPGKPPAGE